MTFIYIGLLMILSYLLGSLPSGVLIGKLFKNIDIREHGSKNTGTTNSIRVLGWGLGLLVFLLDILKGGAVIWLIRDLIGDTSLYAFGTNDVSILAIFGFMAVLGHVFSIFMKFKGGKAVATTTGLMLAIEPWTALAAILIFVAIMLLSRYVSISSTVITGIVTLFYVIRAVIPNFPNTNWPTRILEAAVIISCAVIIILKHKTNYQRLKSGTEHKV